MEVYGINQDGVLSFRTRSVYKRNRGIKSIELGSNVLLQK